MILHLFTLYKPPILTSLQLLLAAVHSVRGMAAPTMYSRDI